MLTSRVLHLIAITSSFTACRCFSAMSSFYGLSDRSMSGELVPMSKFEGKVLCIVNVASACGYTKSNYEQLSQLYDEFPGTLEVLAFPCNQFGAQEPVCSKVVNAENIFETNLY
jgi:glutathione peroxidase-family protein